MSLYEFILTLFPAEIAENPAYTDYFVIGTITLSVLFTALIIRACMGIINIFYK